MIYKLSFIFPLLTLLLLFSCNDRQTNNETEAIKKEDRVFVKKQRLMEGIYYAVDANDSVRFYVNNQESNSFKLTLENDLLLVDSVLVFDGKQFESGANFETVHGERIVQLKSAFGRVHLFVFDATGKCDQVVSGNEVYFFDACVNTNNHTLYTVVTGYGRNPGPFVVYQLPLNDLNKKATNMKLEGTAIDRIERWRMVFEAFN